MPGSSREEEVRLGLVLYGGVSLAVYINGITREFFEAVHGTGVYRVLKALIDSDVVVDIVSGTSAGGINGVLLSHALANNRDFAPTADLWRREADFQRLLEPIDGAAPAAVLRGDFFQQCVESAIAGMPAMGRAEAPSPIEALDLFVTGTDYDGAITTRYDSLGHPLSIKDHRKVFKLKYRRHRLDDLDLPGDAPARSAQVKALAKLSRLTASFPAAFPPTTVDEATTDPEHSANELLRRWGQFQRTTHFLDGGVLDNKPFSYTIREMYYRTAARRVRRKLFYVEPDPERFERGAAERAAPGLFGVVEAALIGIPGYESIADDLKAVDERNAKLRRYESVVAVVKERLRAAIDAGATTCKDLLADSPPQTDIYFQSRIEAMGHAFVEDMLTTHGSWLRRENGDRGPDAVSPQHARQAMEIAEQIHGFAADLYQQFRRLNLVQRRALLNRYDHDFLLRRLFFVTYAIYDLLYPPPDDTGAARESALREDERGGLTLLLGALNRVIQVLKMVEHILGRYRDGLSQFIEPPERAAPLQLPPDLTAEALWVRIDRELDVLLRPGFVADIDADDDSLGRWLDHAFSAGPEGSRWRAAGEWLGDKEIEPLAATLDRRLREIQKRRRPPGNVPPKAAGTMFLEELSARVGEMFNDPSVPLEIRLSYECFEHIDSYTFPLEFLADLREKDQIEVVRMSPLDATLGYSRHFRPADKISGDALHHFGGFLKQSWRGNDILWGRLDGVDLLLECLLTKRRLERVVSTDAAKVRAALSSTGTSAGFSASSLVEAVFPKSAASARGAIQRWLDDLLDLSPPPAGQRLNNRQTVALAAFDQHLELLITAAQREILEGGVRDVIQDSVEQSLGWGIVSTGQSYAAGYAGVGVDGLAGAVVRETASDLVDRARRHHKRAARGVARPRATFTMPALLRPFFQRWAAPTSAAPRDVERFFRREYRVGAETLEKDIPLPVLIQLVAHTLIVFKNVLLRSLADNAPQIAVPAKILRWLIEYPLWVVYGLGRLLTQPSAWRGVLAAAAVFSITVLVLGIVFSLAPMILLGAAVLIVEGAWLRAALSSRGAAWKVVAWLQALAILGAVVLIFWGWASHAYDNFWTQVKAALTWAAAVTVAKHPAFWFLVVPALLFGGAAIVGGILRRPVPRAK